MITGHASHQIGLDADIWFVPMPTRTLSAKERENHVGHILADPAVSSPSTRRNGADQRSALLKRAASYPEVARIFVSAAIKQQLCDTAGTDRDWLRKLQALAAATPIISMCGSSARRAWRAVSASRRRRRGDGCGAELAGWFKPKPPPTQSSR